MQLLIWGHEVKMVQIIQFCHVERRGADVSVRGTASPEPVVARQNRNAGLTRYGGDPSGVPQEQLIQAFHGSGVL